MFLRLLLKLILFLPPEWAHDFILATLPWFYTIRSARYQLSLPPVIPTTLSGLALPNPVGLAAGLDKNARCVDAWFAMGFGFVEIGTVTPRPQLGNSKPRLFRLKKFRALINRMGFNSDGVDVVVQRLKKRHRQGIVGVNLGKNRETELGESVSDYCFSMKKVYPYVDYLTINISSPNTPGLRELQSEAYLDTFLRELLACRDQLALNYRKKLKIFVKIAPDIEPTDLDLMLGTFLKCKVDGIIVGNTTVSREGVQLDSKSNQLGGLSGEPLYYRAKKLVAYCCQYLEQTLPVIAVGGISSPAQAEEMLKLGATAVQIYTGLVYNGPELIKNIVNDLK